MSLLGETLSGGGELEWPEEVVGFLEGGSDSPDLVDEVLHRGNTVLLTEGLLNDGVVVKSNTHSVDLTVSSLVDQASDGVAGWVAVGDVWLDGSEHVDGGSVELDEDTVVELSESQELHDLLALGAELVDTKKHDKIRSLFNTYPLVLMAKAIFASPSIWMLPASLAALLFLILSASSLAYSAAYLVALTAAALRASAR